MPPEPSSESPARGAQEDSPRGMRIVEGSLRLGQQALLVSRMSRPDVAAIAELLDGCGFAAIDVFGGATFEAGVRFLAEDPFATLREVRAAAPRTPLLALVAGQSLVGHAQVPDDVVDAFIRAAAGAGVDVFRCYDPLNDPRNLERCVRAVHASGRRAEGAIVYTESPAHSVAALVRVGVRLRDLGYDGLCVLDPLGLLGAGSAAALVGGLVAETGLDVGVSSAALSGQAGLAYLAAAEAGAATLDGALTPLAGGASLLATEALLHALSGTGHDPAIDPHAIAVASERLDAVVERYRDIADPQAWHLDGGVLRNQVTHAVRGLVIAQLRERDMVDRLDAVLLEMGRVRAELGHPPMITPLAEIVATQAVFNVCDGDRYATISHEVKDYCLGLYGAPPGAVDREVSRLVNGREEPITCRPADLLDPAMAALRREMEREGLDAGRDEAVAAYALFPAEWAALERGQTQAALEPGGQAGPEAEGREPSAAESGAVEEAPAAAAPIEHETRELRVEVEGQMFEVRVHAPPGTFGRGGAALAAGPAADGGVTAREGTVVAPMQGLILSVAVAAGDTVRLGDVVAVLEAMKMQNDVTATRSGRVTAVYVKAGDVVTPRQPVCLVE